MIKKSLLKDTIREITYNKKKFFIIALIMVISSILFVGYNNTILDAKLTENNYRKNNNFMDILITSNVGFSEDDVYEFKNLKNVTGVMLSKNNIIKAKINNKKVNIRISDVVKDRTANNNDYINRFSLSQGRWPSTINEGIVNNKLLADNHITLGALITLLPDNESSMRAKKIKIVGSIKEDNSNYNKNTSYSLYLPSNNFTSSLYENVYITVNEYKNINGVKNEIKKLIKDIEDNKYKEEIEITKSEIESLNQNISDLRSQEGTESDIEVLEEELQNEKSKLEVLEKPSNKIIITKDVTKSISYDDKISKIKQSSFWITIISSILSSCALSYLIIKMFEHKKREIRTLILIGYNKYQIILKYILYAIASCLFGSLFGGILSNTIVPLMILHHYSSASIMVVFQFKYMLLNFVITSLLSSIIISFCTYKILDKRKFSLVKFLRILRKK